MRDNDLLLLLFWQPLDKSEPFKAWVIGGRQRECCWS